MCGRMNVTDSPEVRALMAELGMPLYQVDNPDLRPTQEAMSLYWENGSLSQSVMTWGIKPDWAKKLLINAKSETITDKRTFSKAYRERRCLIPCTGWYEWKDEGRALKTKYLFSHPKQAPFLMAGVWYPHLEGQAQFVTLTTHPNKKCSDIHSRMPVIIERQHLDLWFNGSTEDLEPLLNAISASQVKIEKAA